MAAAVYSYPIPQICNEDDRLKVRITVQTSWRGARGFPPPYFHLPLSSLPHLNRSVHCNLPCSSLVRI